VAEKTGKHGARLDEEMKHETEALLRGGGPTRAERGRDPEPVETDTGRDPTSLDTGRPGGAPPGMTPDDVEERSAVARVLAGVRYPATPGSLVEHAAEEGATDVTVTALERLPERSYGSFAEVTDGLGYGHETRRF
jgi:hypothetical protein